MNRRVNKGCEVMIRTLIVEDDPMVMQINEKFLEKVPGFVHVASVNDLEGAKKLIFEHEPELVLLDIFFSIGKGVDIIHWLREQNLDTDVIFITADRNPKTIEEAFRFGAVDYLIKPFKFDRFEEALVKYKKLRSTYDSQETLDQSSIDSIKGQFMSKSAPTGYDSDLDIKNQTHLDILRLLSEDLGIDGTVSGYTAQEVADKLGISRITARRYLDEMESEKKLELFLEYGKVGRPRNKYRLSKNKDEVDFE